MAARKPNSKQQLGNREWVQQNGWEVAGIYHAYPSIHVQRLYQQASPSYEELKNSVFFCQALKIL